MIEIVNELPDAVPQLRASGRGTGEDLDGRVSGPVQAVTARGTA